MKKKILIIFSLSCVVLFIFAIVFNFVICPRKYKNYVVASAQEFGLELALVYSIIKVESNFDVRAVSKSGARGLMQILPKTGKWIAEELDVPCDEESLFNAETNIKFGCFYLKYLFDKFQDKDIVICAYNAGEGKVLEWIEDGKLKVNKIDFGETRNYLEKVNSYYYIYSNNLINI